MKSSILIFISAILVSFTSSEVDYSKVLPNQIAYTVNDGELILAPTEEASFSAGENTSKIAFKGEVVRKFKASDKVVFYAGKVKKAQVFTFDIVKLNLDGNKRSANYNSLSGKKISTVATKSSEVGHPGVFEVTLNEPLAVGHYAAVFSRVGGSGNFLIFNDYKNNPISFEVVE